MHRTSTGTMQAGCQSCGTISKSRRRYPLSRSYFYPNPYFAGRRRRVRILAQTNLRLVLRFVHPGISRPHFIGNLEGCSNLNQRSGSNPRTVHGGGFPGGNILHQLRPEGEKAALCRLGGMDPATGLVQKVTLRVPRLPQPDDIARPVNVLRFESGRRHAQKSGCFRDVGFAQVHVAVLPAARRTTCLTSKPKPVHLNQDHM